MAAYKSSHNRALAQIRPEERLSNQVVLSGTGESYPVPKGIFFLEYLETDGLTTVTIKDGKGRTITTGMGKENFNQEHSPLVCEYGIAITGDVTIAKGFFLNGILLAP